MNQPIKDLVFQSGALILAIAAAAWSFNIFVLLALCVVLLILALKRSNPTGVKIASWVTTGVLLITATLMIVYTYFDLYYRFPYPPWPLCEPFSLTGIINDSWIQAMTWIEYHIALLALPVPPPYGAP